MATSESQVVYYVGSGECDMVYLIICLQMWHRGFYIYAMFHCGSLCFCAPGYESNPCEIAFVLLTDQTLSLNALYNCQHPSRKN